ncbi:IclR family transcriptional regulator [uncultured Jatrophihabitans sp.]|uniref:IclR family transcriptional regulator n=1 Tax=uncultured Jatrophihabitans sp. TaxID=1610747 RepID=UPI0035CB422B
MQQANAESERSVVRRALMVLDCFLGNTEERTVTQISRETGLPMATVHRLLATLIEWGGVERHGRGRYRLSMHVWRLGASAPHARALRDVALPFLEDLREATHEVVHLAVLDGTHALYLEKLPSRQAATVISRVGRRLPLHATGPGKVLLAYSSPDLLEQVIAAGLRPITTSTIVTESQLRSALAEIRRTGLIVSRNEMTDGSSSVAAPVFGPGRSIMASLAVVVRSDGVSPTELAPLVRIVASSLSRALTIEDTSESDGYAGR